MNVDNSFKEYFNGRLHQVFLYLTDACQLRCEQCLYKTILAQREMDLKATLEMIEIFRNYGAEKLTLIGGEPTLYGYEQMNRPLFKVIEKAKELNYKYIRLDTNGLFRKELLLNSSFQKLDNLAFSLDGHKPEINDLLRGKKTFGKSIKRIIDALELNYYVTLTACIHPENIYHIEDMIDFFTNLGIKEFNMHPLFKMGIERDSFSGNTHIPPKEWLKIYKQMRTNIDAGKYKIQIRIPQRFIDYFLYNQSPEMYNYCPVKMGERILVHPNGEMRICALCIGSSYTIAHYNYREIIFSTLYSEVYAERLKLNPCMSQTKDFGDITPLCISFKPFQKEYIWENQKFDDKFLSTQITKSELQF